MSFQTGEDEQSLRKILDLLRTGGILLLLLHYFYHACPSCREWQNATPIADSILSAIAATGLFDPLAKPKVIALCLLGISLLGSHGQKNPKYTPSRCITYLITGLALYFTDSLLLDIPVAYMLITSAGYLLILYGGIYLTRIVWRRPEPDIFNRLHESFPQEERLLENTYSLHLPAQYVYDKQLHNSWINFIDPFRGSLILGTPGSGKTWYIIEPLIKQYIQKSYALLVYDFKYDDLSKLVYNCFEEFKHHYPGTPAHYNLHFGDLCRSHRCNPLHPATLHDLQDAGEAARAVVMGMSSQGFSRHGEFFLESAINFVQALIWFLRLYKDGCYCSWPHVIELAQIPYDDLFTVLAAQPQLKALVNPFMNAKMNAPEMLDGQIATAAIGLAKLSSPAIYYIMSGDDFTLDLNDPAAPKLVTIGSNPQKTETYGPMISAYVNTINRLCNRKGTHPLAEIFDEFGTVKVHTIVRSIATGRSNKMAITLCVQDLSQLRLAYGREFADVIFNTCGNIISGQASGDTAKSLSERFGRTMQDRESLTTTDHDLHITQSGHLEHAIPVSRIASLSSGEFVGLVADNPFQPIDLKTFCSRITNDPAALARQTENYMELPVLKKVTPGDLDVNFHRIRNEVTALINSELVRIGNSPEYRHLLP